MKKCIILIAILFSGMIFAQESKPVLEPFGKKVKATYFFENGQVQQEGFFENGKLEGVWVMMKKEIKLHLVNIKMALKQENGFFGLKKAIMALTI